MNHRRTESALLPVRLKVSRARDGSNRTSRSSRGAIFGKALSSSPLRRVAVRIAQSLGSAKPIRHVHVIGHASSRPGDPAVKPIARAKSRAEKVKHTLRTKLNALPHGDEIRITTAGQVDIGRLSGKGASIRGTRFHRSNVTIRFMNGARVDSIPSDGRFENDEFVDHLDATEYFVHEREDVSGEDEVYVNKLCAVCDGELLESELGGYCPYCGGEAIQVEEASIERELGNTALSAAVEYNRKRAGSVGWRRHRAAIVKSVLRLDSMPSTEDFARRVATWQHNNGLDDDGKLGPGTWARMKHVLGIPKSARNVFAEVGPLPVIDTRMPDPVASEYRLKARSRNQGRQYGIRQTIDALLWITRTWHRMHPEILIGIGDISRQGGGKLKPHTSHRLGLDVDLALFDRATNRRISRKGAYRKYRPLIRAFLDLVVDNQSLDVKTMFYFDHALSQKIRNSKSSAKHHQHIHIRFCRPPELKQALDRKKVGTAANYDCGGQSELDKLNGEWYQAGVADMEDALFEGLGGKALAKAVDYNRRRARSVGWYQHFNLIVANALKLNYSPGEPAFAMAVADWQRANSLADDGKLGPSTWSKMKKIQGIGSSKPKSQTSPKTSYKVMDWTQAEQISLLNDFAGKYSSKTFKNSTEINDFFKRKTGHDFCEWFRQNVGSRGFFGKIPHNSKYTGPRGRSAINIQKGQESNFRKVFDNIPLLYSGDALSSKRVNLLEIFALTCIIINEHSGNFTVGTEKGDLPYLFKYNPKDRSSQRSAYNLLHNRMFMGAHRHKGRVPPRPFDKKWQLRGSKNYPSSAPTDVNKGGLISEMDFCKFRGRGLTQITFRRSYRGLISHIMHSSYRSSSPIINNFKKKYAGKSSNTIAVLSSNKEWDDLVLKTNYEIACVAIYVFQKSRNEFLDIDFNTTQLIKEHRNSSGAGSLFYVGYRQGGTRHYGRVVKKRVMQMMDALVGS